MSSRPILALLAVVSILPLYAHASPTGTEDRQGLRCISRTAFPVPSGVEAVVECSFEGSAKVPPGWSPGNGEVVTAPDAPEGKAYFRMRAKKQGGLVSPVFQGKPGSGYFLSYWVKTAADPWTTINFTSDEREPSYSPIHTPIFYQDFPLNTGGEWRQEGFYFVMPPQCKTLQFNIGPREDGAADEFVCIDDVRLRTATAAEVDKAYRDERANYPAYEVNPGPGDGKNLALSIAKWEGRAGIPGKPFVIWALGSSFTDRQGDGEELIRAIRERFPKAPPIIYRKHGGPGEPWEFIDGWIQQFVATEDPDLIFTYTSGTLEGLDAMLTSIRRRTTAEVILPTLHFKPDSTMTPDDIERGAGVRWDQVREICAKHGVEFVENRRELADYIRAAHLVPDDLLADHNHQNMHGRIRIWDDVIAHLSAAAAPGYAPDSRERMIHGATPNQSGVLSVSGNWRTEQGSLQSRDSAARLKLTFTGNRVDIIGRAVPGGGSVRVLIDGVSAESTPVYVMNYIKPIPRNWRIPHLVDLGGKITPQNWTITMTNDTGDFRLDGSVTGSDGTGNLSTPFVSTSKQISLDLKFWRQAKIEKKGQPVEYGVKSGDKYTFDVFHAATARVSFQAEQPTRLEEPLARNLPNAEHTVEVIANGDGEVAIDGFYVFEPPEK
ncbi:MAG TPA: hypothetical protein VGM54_19520 [Chthoniobacter sp.]|jgi:hypothetical protein